jgi:hypothetical protein
MIEDLRAALMISPADHFVFRTLLKPIILATIFGVIYFLVRLIYGGIYTRRRVIEIAWSAVGYSIPIVSLAFVAGYLTGISRSPAVGAVVPAVLTMIGALNVFVFGVMKSTGETRIAVGYTVFLFATLFFYGVQTGAYWREYGQEERLRILSKQESGIRNFRKNMGLPEDPPSWIWQYDQKEETK